MLGIIFLAAFALTSVSADKELVILHSPEKVEFNEPQLREVRQSLLIEVFSKVLGFTYRNDRINEEWSSLRVNDVLDPAKAVVNIVIDGVESVDLKGEKRFRLIADELENSTWHTFSSRIKERTSRTVSHIRFEDFLKSLDSPSFGSLKPETIDQASLNFLTVDKDNKFIKEIGLLRAIANRKINDTPKAEDKPIVFWFVFTGLQSIYKSYDSNSAARKEAVALLNDALNSVAESFKKIYNDQVIITVFPYSDYPRNRAENFSETDQAMLQIAIWFSASLGLSLLAICIAIANMDPGKDSIIYRMTSQKIKKEN